MPELRREVKPIEVNYLCDKCEKGMVIKKSQVDDSEHNHQCVICGEQYSFSGKGYPRVIYRPVE